MREFRRSMQTTRWPRAPLALTVVLAALAIPAAALAHVERPAYWPDPAPDTSVNPAAGGKVPKARSLASALDGSQPGDTRVVCKQSSLHRALSSIRAVETKGYKLRPTMRRRTM